MPVQKPSSQLPSDPPSKPVRRRSRYTADHLIEEAEIAMSRVGYHGLNLGDLAKAIGVGRTAVLHHWKKEELALAALSAYATWWRNRLGDPLEPGPAGAMERLADACHDAFARSGRDALPLPLTLAAEIHTLPEGLRTGVRAHYDRTVRWAKTALGGSEQARVQATYMLSLLEGSMMLARGNGQDHVRTIVQMAKQISATTNKKR